MNNLKDIIFKSENIGVTSHLDPDGDSIGSILGLSLALKQVCRNVDVFINEQLPDRYSFLPQSNSIKSHEDIRDKKYDLIFVLDCGDKGRLGKNIELMEGAGLIVNIDHHISNTKFGHINIIDINASSTCEMVYRIIKDLDLKIDKEIGTCLYMGIITDTGNFMYDNATYQTYLTAAQLIKTNIDKQEIIYNLYQKRSINNLKFLGHCLTNVEMELDGQLAIFQIPLTLLDKFNLPKDDIEGIVNYGRDIDGVEISVSLREIEDNKVKLSFRSKHDEIDVRALAQLFNGGGHKKAAGATVTASLDETKNQVIEKAKQFLRR